MNGKVQQQVNSPHLTKVVLDAVDAGQSVRLGIQTLTTNGPVSVVKEITYRREKSTETVDSDPEREDLVRLLNSSDFHSGRKRMVRQIVIYPAISYRLGQLVCPSVCRTRLLSSSGYCIMGNFRCN